MNRNPWIVLGLALTMAGGADATARSVAAPRAISYDIVAQTVIPANETCGHYATYNGSGVTGLDWAVNGSVVAYDADGINYTNDGSAYTVAVGEVNGGYFTEYYSEIFYPVTPGRPGGMACLQI